MTAEFLKPGYISVTVSAKCLHVVWVIILVIAIFMMSIKLTYVFRYESASFAIPFTMMLMSIFGASSDTS